MEITNVKGKEVLIARTPYMIFSTFADLRSFTDNIPDEYRGQVVSDQDSIMAEIKGLKLGVRIDKRVPYSLISLVSDGESPFPFNFTFHLQPVGLDSTLFHMEMNAELSMMMKMMIGKKLQEVIDKLTDQIERAVSGQPLDVSAFKPENFS